MDHSYPPYYDPSSSPWSNQARNGPGPGSEAGLERRAGLPGMSPGHASEDHGQAILFSSLVGPLTHTASDVDKRPAQTDHGRYAWSNTVFDYRPSLCGARRAVDMPYWTPIAYTPDQPPSSNLAIQPFPNNTEAGALKDHSVPLLHFGTYPSDLLFPRPSYTSDAVSTEQQGRTSWPAVDTIDDDTATTARIGSVLSNGKFVCDDECCAGQTFGRPSELRRHHTTFHAANKPSFWCHDPTCRRSVDGGGEAFHRRDKLAAHVNSMHS